MNESEDETMPQLENVDETLHVRVDGQTFRFSTDSLDMSDEPTDAEVLEAAAQAVQTETGNAVSLDGYEVERYVENGLINVHPQAKFGL